MSVSITGIEKAEIFPLNPPASGAYSFYNGYPIVSFQVAPQDKYLDCSTLRLNGTLRLNAPGSTEAVPIRAGNRSGTATKDGICLNSRIGVASCIQQITLATQTGQTLEVIRAYGRYMASVMGATHSASDLDGAVGCVNPGSASRTIVGGVQCNEDVAFSIPLRTGLLNSGQPLPLGQMAGLTLNLELAPDAQAISGYYDYTAGDDQLFDPISTGAFYQLRDLSLSYDLLVPADASKIPASGAIAYNSISSQYGVLNASDQTVNYNLGTTNTLAVFHNFISTGSLNTYSADSYATAKLYNTTGGGGEAYIKRVSFLRGGSRFPLDYSPDVEDEGIAGVVQSDLDIKYLDAIKPLADFNHCLMATSTQVGFPTETTFEAVPTPRATLCQVEPLPVFGAGVRLDVLSKVGVSFKDTTYGVRVESVLDGVSPNSIFTYCVAKNTLAYSPQGITVSS